MVVVEKRGVSNIYVNVMEEIRILAGFWGNCYFCSKKQLVA
jgi:hypothetical protein